MIKTKFVPTKYEEIEAIICDSCGREMHPTDHIEYQESFSIVFTGGYGSIFGDGVDITCDLCQYCLHKMIKDFYYLDGERDID